MYTHTHTHTHLSKAIDKEHIHTNTWEGRDIQNSVYIWCEREIKIWTDSGTLSPVCTAESCWGTECTVISPQWAQDKMEGARNWFILWVFVLSLTFSRVYNILLIPQKSGGKIITLPQTLVYLWNTVHGCLWLLTCFSCYVKMCFSLIKPLTFTTLLCCVKTPNQLSTESLPLVVLGFLQTIVQ